MTNKLLIMAAAFGFCSLSSAVTLQEAYQAAVQKTEVVPIAESQLRASDTRVDAARANFLPEISAKVDYLYQNQKIGTTNDNSQTTPRLNLVQSLFAGGGDKALYNATQSIKSSQEYNVKAVKFDLYADVADSFYTLLSARKEVENIESSITLVQKRVVELEKLKKVGRSREIDVLAANAQESVLEAQRLAAVAARRIAKNNFFAVTGLDRDSTLTDDTKLPEKPDELKKYLESIDSRADVLSLKSLNESFDSAISAASAGHWPSLDLTGNYYLGHSGAATTSQNADDWNAGLTLTVPLYAGGAVKAQVSQAEEQKNQSDLLLQKKRRDAEVEIRTAYNNLISAVEQTKALEKALTATEQNYKEQEKDYRYRLATNLDVLQSLNSFLDTKRTLDRIHFQALSAFVLLKARTNQIEL